MGDEALLEAAQRGDAAAFNGLVVVYQRQVYNLCLRTLGHPEDAADATQEAFFGAYRALGSFRGTAASFRAWLFRIAVNACYDHHRRRARRPAQSLESLGGEPGEERSGAESVPDPGPGPEQRSGTSETRRTIQAGLARLSADQRLVVVLCDVQGFGYEEAARMMGVELGTVKSRLSRARAHLREFLAAHGELPTVGQRQNQ